ncbi:MAG: hypothetical protein HC819_19920 [Cyclobacteriaceae bacterium]|nr:hypothetical protein [Cyclobacteriaceae bacterium]
MQASHLVVAFQIISFPILVGCEINAASENELIPGVCLAKELVFVNRLVEAEQEISKIDTNALDEVNKGAYFLTNAFLQHELGNRAQALSSMSKASELISSSDNDLLKAELSLINGFIFEQLILRSEALHSYFKAYEYFREKTYPDKLFYTFLGIGRTSPGGSEYLKMAEKLLDELKSNRFRVLYLNAKASLVSDVSERNRIILKSLDYFDENHALKKQVSIYTGIALNYQLLDLVDSAYHYLEIAQEIIQDNQLPPEQNFHFYIIKAFIESDNHQNASALETLAVLFNHATNEPGILSQAFLRRSLIMKDQGKFEEAYFDLKKYRRLEEEERAKADRYQLGLLSIRYQLQQKELQLTRMRYKWFLTMGGAVLSFVILWAAFWLSRKKLAQKKKAIELKYEKTHKLLNEQVEESIKEEQFKQQSEHYDRKSMLDTELKLQEFGAIFRIHHPLFRERLSKAHPELTLNDLKHCDCILAGVTVFQITKILGVSEGAVKKARKKLRTLFRCGSTKDLYQYLQKIDEGSSN